MTATESKPTVESIQHLDFAPQCEARERGCRGTNPADYMAAINGPCCPCHKAFCSRCIYAFVSLGSTLWRCGNGHEFGPGTWLDFVTLHPLGGKP